MRRTVEVFDRKNKSKITTLESKFPLLLGYWKKTGDVLSESKKYKIQKNNRYQNKK